MGGHFQKQPRQAEKGFITWTRGACHSTTLPGPWTKGDPRKPPTATAAEGVCERLPWDTSSVPSLPPSSRPFHSRQNERLRSSVDPSHPPWKDQLGFVLGLLVLGLLVLGYVTSRGSSSVIPHHSPLPSSEGQDGVSHALCPSLCHPGSPRMVSPSSSVSCVPGRRRRGGEARENSPPGRPAGLHSLAGFHSGQPVSPQPPREDSETEEVPRPPQPRRRQLPPWRQLSPGAGAASPLASPQFRWAPPHLGLVFPVAQLGAGGGTRRKTPSGRPNSFWLPQRDRGLLKPPGSVPSVSIQARCCRTKCGVPLAPWAHSLWAAPLPPWGVPPKSHTCYAFVLQPHTVPRVRGGGCLLCCRLPTCCRPSSPSSGSLSADPLTGGHRAAAEGDPSEGAVSKRALLHYLGASPPSVMWVLS